MQFLLIIALAFLIYAHRSMGLTALEDTAWEVRVGVAPFFPFAKKDMLSFGRGRFASARSLADGFVPGGYGALDIPGAWQARLKGEDGIVREWRGTVRGDRIKGTVTVVRADGSIKTYKFRGRRRGV